MDEWRITTARNQALAAGEALAERGPTWLLVTEGAVALEAGGEGRALRAGDAVLVAPGLTIVVTACVDSLVAVNDLVLARPTHPLPAVTVVRGFARRHEGIAALASICPMAARCGPPLMTASYAGLIGSAVLASWLEDAGRSAHEEPPADPAVAAVVAAVTARPGDPWTVGAMAAVVHLSRSALGERFRRSLGRSPAEVLRDARMQEARHLLRTTPASVEHVAHAVGYGSTAAFSRAFAAHHGTAPQEWRTRGDGPGSGPGDRSGARRAQRREGQPGERRDARPQQQRRHDSVRVDQRAS